MVIDGEVYTGRYVMSINKFNFKFNFDEVFLTKIYCYRVCWK
jgi:hypothetical protein